jgi:signal peptidase I
MSEKSMNPTRLQRILREVFVLGLLVIGIMAARSTLADHYHVPSGSMEYTLMIGDRVFVDKRAYGLRVPFTNFKMTQGDTVARGDIVIFDSPRDGKRLIKRIVAVGGDIVELQAGRLTINGQRLDVAGQNDVERIGDKLVQLKLASGGGPDIRGVIDPGMVLAIGDHRGNSVDGRVFGAVPADEIYGRAVAVYYRRGNGFSWIGL